MDRLLAKVGLHGKSFIPLLEQLRVRDPGHHGDADDRGSQEPAGDDLDRAVHELLARLPVYTLLIGTFFATAGALAQAGIMLRAVRTGHHRGGGDGVGL